jgi:hypothetical protein
MTVFVGRRRRRNAALSAYSAGMSVAGLNGTFTRSTTATYIDANGVVQTAAINTLRDGHYIGGVRTTLLEASRTNLILNSADFSTTWTNTADSAPRNNVVTTNNQTAPDGTLTADTIAFPAVASGASQYSLRRQPVATATNGSYTASVWLKAAAPCTIYLYVPDNASNVGRSVACGVTTAWQRFSVSVTTSATITSVYFDIGANGLDYAHAIGATTVYAWGAQLEQAAFLSSYIPTTTVAVTRGSDALTFPTTFDQQALTIYAQYIEQGSASLGLCGLVTVGNQSVLPTAAVYINGSGIGGLYQRSGGLSQPADVAMAPVFGDSMEVRLTLSSTGVVQVGASKNAAAEVVDTPSSATALTTGWGSSQILLNDISGPQKGFVAIRSVRIAAGVQSLATMRGL